MSEETELLVHAIKSLRQDDNLFKDYIFPIVSGFFSALLGAGVAYFTLKYQEDIQIEKEKMDVANKWTLISENALASLLAIKTNYENELNDNPIQRALKVPTVLHNAKPINEEVLDLIFLVPKADDKRAQDLKWRGLPRIRSMVSNYNFLLDVWEKRNSIDRPIKVKLHQDYSDVAFVEVTKEQIIESVGIHKLIELVDLTQRVIKSTDELILEFHDFISEFPDIAKNIINTKKIKKYGSIITYSSEGNPKLIEKLEKVPEVNYEILAELFGINVDEVKNSYSTGYE